MTRRQHHKGRKRLRSWHRGRGEARRWDATPLPDVGTGAAPDGRPTPVHHQRRTGKKQQPGEAL